MGPGGDVRASDNSATSGSAPSLHSWPDETSEHEVASGLFVNAIWCVNLLRPKTETARLWSDSISAHLHCKPFKLACDEKTFARCTYSGSSDSWGRFRNASGRDPRPEADTP